MRLAAWTLASAALIPASCTGDKGAGYVEIKLMPTTAAIVLYLDAVKLDPIRNGNALVHQQAGVAKLQVNSDGANLVVLCNIEVKKNRITTVTISAMSRQVRCQCNRTSGTDTGAIRTCIG